MRLFISLNLSHESRAQLATLLDDLRSRSVSGNFVLPENLHVTLVFLGECDAKKLIVLERIIRTVPFEPFTLTTSGGGYLDKGRPNLVFCDLKNDKGFNRLRKLQSDVLENLSVKGFNIGSDKFWPHITLGRRVVWKDTGKYTSFIEVNFPQIEECVTSISLMKSEQIDGRVTYTSLFEKRA